VLPPGRTATLLVGYVRGNRGAAIADVATETNVREVMVPGVLANPRLRHSQEVSDFVGR
jgi:hypothetical protein